MNLLGVLEGILFVVGDEGATLEEISKILEINKNEVKELLLQLKEKYESEERGIRIRYLGNAFKLTTKEEHKPYYQKFLTNNVDHRTLSSQALEILAIIAYNEPITRVQIDEIRGVSSVHHVRKLLLKNLIREVGKSDLPGRPLLYGVTKEFLDYFGLSTIDDLPKVTMSSNNEVEQVDLFESKYKEN